MYSYKKNPSTISCALYNYREMSKQRRKSYKSKTIHLAPRKAGNSIYKPDKEQIKNEAVINVEVILFINQVITPKPFLIMML